MIGDHVAHNKALQSDKMPAARLLRRFFAIRSANLRRYIKNITSRSKRMLTALCSIQPFRIWLHSRSGAVYFDIMHNKICG